MHFGGGEEEVRERTEVSSNGNEEKTPVENDREKVPRKRAKEEMFIDRLSDLPDPLLLHILSFLDLKEAAVTGLLSKRWRFIWFDLPKLIFWESNAEYWDSSRDGEKIGRFVSWVNRTLAARSVNNLEKFQASLQYSECYCSDLDGWVEFALEKKVKTLILILNCHVDFYLLPEVLYSSSSLTCLWVRGCIMAPDRKIEWPSLTTLSLKEVEVTQDVIDEILSSCLALNWLALEGYWGFGRMEVNSRNMHRLSIEDCEDDDEAVLEISAPYLHALDISVFPEGRDMQLRNTPSLVSVRINFNGFGWESDSAEVISATKELIGSIQHVKELRLGRRCFEVVSVSVANGWQIPESRRRFLDVTSSSDYDHSISGIIGLLESSPYLEALVLDGFDTDGEYADLDPAAKGDLDRDLLHLKTINITNFADPNGEPMLILARILLKRATSLEKMVIVIDVQETDVVVKITRALLSYPRSSPNAVVRLYQQVYS